MGASASLPLDLTQLDHLIGQAREALLEVVNMTAAGKRIYQQQIDIPKKTGQESALLLAQAGFRLYQKIFFSAKADQQARLLGQRLRELAEGSQIRVQVFSTEFLLPWGLLYLAEEMPQTVGQVDQKRFLGLRHMIEHIPWQTNLSVLDSDIHIGQGLQVGLNVNTDIDREMDKRYVAEQLEEWEEIRQRGEALVAVRRDGDEVLQALKSGSATDQVMYFYCHAASHSLVNGGDPGKSALMLTGRQPVYLDDLQTTRELSNLCPAAHWCSSTPANRQSCRLCFMRVSCLILWIRERGVIGTECDVPAVFARYFASAFFQRFLQGTPLGEAVLKGPQEFAKDHNNLLGLLYAVYVDADTRLVQA